MPAFPRISALLVAFVLPLPGMPDEFVLGEVRLCASRGDVCFDPLAECVPFGVPLGREE
jgi:hypothetical protein